MDSWCGDFIDNINCSSCDTLVYYIETISETEYVNTGTEKNNRWDFEDLNENGNLDLNESNEEFLDLGFYISFSGIVTFPKALETHNCAKIVPNDKYLIETDSPFLAPVPFRGKRNEPSFVESVALSLASIRSSEFQTIAIESSRNAEKLFNFVMVN